MGRATGPSELRGGESIQKAEKAEVVRANLKTDETAIPCIEDPNNSGPLVQHAGPQLLISLLPAPY
jgi:hypothetical protein